MTTRRRQPAADAVDCRICDQQFRLDRQEYFTNVCPDCLEEYKAGGVRR